jgi:hypothetical protein
MAGSDLACTVLNTMSDGLFSMSFSEFFLFGGSLALIVTASHYIINPIKTEDKFNESSGGLCLEKRHYNLNSISNSIKKLFSR